MKNLSSPSPTKPSGLSRSVSSSSITDLQQRFSSPKRFREANENEQARSLQKPMKTPTKHFMSPTISAASKAVAPKKKILSERNDGSGDAHYLVNPGNDQHDGFEDLGFDGHSVRSSQNSTTPLSTKGFERDDDLLDPSFQPYDPLTNYLSPRPKFLRYNPNRRVEILQRREGDRRKRGEEFGIVDSNASIESQKLSDEGLIQSMSSFLEENSLKQGESSPNADKSSPESCRNGDSDTNQCSNEENSEKAAEEQTLLKASDGSSLLGDGYSSGEGRASDSSSTLEGYIPSDDSLEPQLSDVEESADWDADEEDEEEDEDEDEEEESHWNVTRAFKMLLVILLSVLSISFAVPSQSLVDLKQGYYKLQHHFSQAGVNNIVVSDNFFGLKQENEHDLIGADVTVGAEGMQNPQMDEKLGDVSETLQEIAAEVANSYQVYDSLLEEIQNMSDVGTIAEDMTIYAEKSVEEWKAEDRADVSTSAHFQRSDAVQFEKIDDDDDAIQFEKPEVAFWDDTQVPTENVAVHEVAKEEKVEHGMENIEAAVESCKLVEASTEDLTKEEAVRKEDKPGDESDNPADATNGIVEILRSRGRAIGGDVYESQDSSLNEFMFNEIDDDQITGFNNFSTAMELQHKDSLTVPTAFTLIAMGATLLSVCVAFKALRFLHQKCKRISSKGSKATNPKSLGAKSVEFRSAPLLKRATEEKKVDYYAKPATSAHYNGNGYQKYYETPAVELLGEYVVSPFNSPFRRHEIEAKPVESEASSLSCSDEKRPRRKAVSSANHECSTLSDYSAAQSPSYGSFTTQEKILMKEGGRDGEEYTKRLNTPVRRSSRLANRSVTSP